MGCVLVTGGRRGIGRGIALAFARDGWDVVISDLERDADAEETLAALGAQGAFVQGDVGDLAGHGALLDAAWAAFGGVDCLVNNAGVTVAVRGDLLDVAPESYDRIMDINLRGTFFLTQAVAKRWLAEPARVRRSIISLGSINTEAAAVDRAEYCFSKAGIGMLTKLFALRLAEADIAAFEIRPGVIHTPMTAVVTARYDAMIAAGGVPAKRWGEPSDIGGVAAALASGPFHYSSGEFVYVDGGMHIPRQ